MFESLLISHFALYWIAMANYESHIYPSKFLCQDSKWRFRFLIICVQPLFHIASASFHYEKFSTFYQHCNGHLHPFERKKHWMNAVNLGTKCRRNVIKLELSFDFFNCGKCHLRLEKWCWTKSVITCELRKLFTQNVNFDCYK